MTKAMTVSGGSPADRLRNRRLVVFDVDGTLYDQSRLRRAMAARLLSHAALTGRISTLRALKAYRHKREITAESLDPDFETVAVAAAARAGKMSEERARALVEEWMHRRPLLLLAACRYKGVAELFDHLRRKGVIIGILSDYPVAAKLHALGLKADVIAHAGGADVPLQKPDPGGLRHLMQVTDTPPNHTILIGDRDDRDGEAGRRGGVDVLLRADRPARPDMFRSFMSLLAPPGSPA